MKYIFSIFLFSTVLFVNAQAKLKTKAGNITFEASVPAFEQVKAKNEAVTCVLRARNGEIACLALIKGFRFKLALMEEHFNENYAESDKFSKAIFRGKLENFSVQDVTETAKVYNLVGKLQLHGKINDVKTEATVKKTTAGIEILTNFTLLASDYDIKIPSLVKNKVTNKVNLKCDFVVK